jgi:hypothetical protein
MTTGSVATSSVDADVRDGSKHLRDIEELVAKLAIVNKLLAFPARPADAGPSTARES